MKFTVELKDGAKESEQEVEMYLDDEGLVFLLAKLESLKKEQKGHEHFMTPSWAGNELTETKMVESNHLINHLKVTLL